MTWYNINVYIESIPNTCHVPVFESTHKHPIPHCSFIKESFIGFLSRNRQFKSIPASAVYFSKTRKLSDFLTTRKQLLFTVSYVESLYPVSLGWCLQDWCFWRLFPYCETQIIIPFSFLLRTSHVFNMLLWAPLLTSLGQPEVQASGEQNSIGGLSLLC